MKMVNAFADSSAAATSGAVPGWAAAAASPSAMSEISNPTHVDTNTIAATGAAVESTM
jgi:hypothetical protein